MSSPTAHAPPHFPHNPRQRAFTTVPLSEARSSFGNLDRAQGPCPRHSGKSPLQRGTVPKPAHRAHALGTPPETVPACPPPLKGGTGRHGCASSWKIYPEVSVNSAGDFYLDPSFLHAFVDHRVHRVRRSQAAQR